MPDTSEQPKSAPELPHEVAKTYGLHVSKVSDGTDPDNTQATLNDDAASEDPETDAAVDSILRAESDELLGLHQEVPQHGPVHHGSRLARFCKAWWRNKWARYTTLIVLFAAIVTVAAIPRTRYLALNTVGVRVSASVIVEDDTTQLPLKNVSVTIGNTTVHTNVQGVAKVTGLKLGDTTLTIRRLAFASQSQHLTLGWGSNPLGTFKLTAAGTQYTFKVLDYLSGKPLVGANVENADYNALSDNSGKVTFTVADTTITSLSVTVSANHYRSQSLTLDATQHTAADVVLVPAIKEVFMSNQGGRYDVYSADLDGQNKKLLLAGTGSESSSSSLVVSPDGSEAALVSARDNTRDSDGYELTTLTLIHVQQGSSVTIDRAEQIELVDWIGTRLIYRATYAGASAPTVSRNRLIAYNYDTNAKAQLASANQFNTIISAGGSIYFAVSSTDPNATLGLFKIQPDGSSLTQLSHAEIWTGVRTAYNTLALQAPDGWYAYTLGSGDLVKAQAPTTFKTYLFTDDSTGQTHAWVDERDGKGTLLLHHADGSDTSVAAQTGLTYPVRWGNDQVLLYRVTASGESADYVVSTAGGNTHKITDVVSTYGYSQIY